jgi:hypothetical protein
VEVQGRMVEPKSKEVAGLSRLVQMEELPCSVVPHHESCSGRRFCQ